MAQHSSFRRAARALGALLLALGCARAAQAAPVLVSGEATVTSVGSTISLTQTFVNPVVIAFPATRSGSVEPVIPRVSAVTPTSFFLKLQEPSNLDGVHPAETVSYIVVEAGIHTLETGRTLAAGFATMTAGTQLNTAFGYTFSAVPLVLAQTQTISDPTMVHVRIDRARAQDWRGRLEQQESIPNGHGTETVGWVAIDLGVTTESSFKIAAVSTGISVTQANFTVMFGTAFSSTPSLLAMGVTRRNADPAWVRRDAVPGSFDRVVLFMQEDTTNDVETNHPAETVNVLALPPGTLLSDPPTLSVAAVEGAPSGVIRSGATAEPLCALSLTGDPDEALGSVTLAFDISGSASAASLTSLALYEDVNGNGRVDAGVDTLVQGGVSVSGSQASFAVGSFATNATKRLLLAGNVGATSGTYVFTVENANVSGSGARGGEAPVVSGAPIASATRTVSASPGVPMGELGRLGAVGESWTAVTFRNTYESPVVVAGTGSHDNAQAASVRLRNVTTTGFEVSLVSDPGNATAFTTESVHYLALEKGSYTLPATPSDLHVEVRSIDTSKTRGNRLAPDLEEVVAFTQSFAATPAVLSQIQTDAASGYSYTRERLLTTSSFSLFIEDEESSTVQHAATETLGWVAVDPTSAPAQQSGRSTEFALTADAFNQNVNAHALSASYAAPPLGLATLVKIDAQDNAHARVESSAYTPGAQLNLSVEEDEGFDAEVNHTAEMLAIAASDGVGTIYGPQSGSLTLANPPNQADTLLREQTAQQPVLGVALATDSIEGATGVHLTFTFTGTANPTSVTKAQLYLDPEGDGLIGGSDTQVGVDATFTGNQVSFDVPDLARSTTRYYLLTYDIGAGTDGETYGALLDNAGVVASGALSAAVLPVSGGPIDPGPRPLVIAQDPQIVGVFGRVPSVSEAWQTVTLARTVANPVVIVGPPSVNAVDPCVVRVRNATSTSFEIRLQEPSNLDGLHAGEEVHYLVVSAGTHTLSGGAVLEAGTVVTDNTITRRYRPRRFSTVTFPSAFSAVPVVLASLNTMVDAKYANLRQRNLTTTTFQFGIEEDEAQTTKHAAQETIGWVAITTGTGTQPVGAYEALPSPATFRQANYVLPFTSAFLAKPTFLLGLTRISQNDPAHLRSRSITATNATVFIEEDTAFDAEVNHALETANYLALEGSGFLTNNLVPPDPVTNLRASPGQGQITLDWTNPSTTLQEVVIRYSTTSYPETTSDGFAAESGVVPATAGTDGSLIHNNLDPANTYYYSVWARTAEGLISERRTVSAQPLVAATSFSIDVNGASAGLIAGERYALTVSALQANGSVSSHYVRTVALTWARVAPTRDSGTDLELGTSTVADNGSLMLSFAASPGTLTFAAPDGLRYADAGQIQITVTDAQDPSIHGETLVGFRPYAFDVSATTTSGLRAGDSATLQVRAVIADGTSGTLSDNPTARNYECASNGLSVTNSYQSPATGTLHVSPTQATLSAGDNGSASLAVTYLDAGSIVVDVSDPSYLGGQISGSSPVLGWTPHHFAVTVDTPPDNRDFFYAVGDGEPFGVGVEARASNDARTLNYRGSVVFTSDLPAMRVADPLTFGDAEAGVSKTGKAFQSAQVGEAVPIHASDSQDPGVTGNGPVNVRFPEAAVVVRGAQGHLPFVAVQVEIVEAASGEAVIHEDISTRFDLRIVGEDGGEVSDSARITLNPEAPLATYVRSLDDVAVASGGRITVFVYDTEVETVTLAVDRTDPVLVPTDHLESSRGDAVFGFGGIDAERIRVLQRREQNAGESLPASGNQP